MKTLPNVLSILRLVLAPLVFLSIQSDQLNKATLLVVFAIITDLMDGLLARRWRSTSHFGSYMDVVADFGFLLAASSALVLEQVYSPWLLAIMIAMFLQFVLCPKQGRLVYDPVGKYYGALLYGLILLTLIASAPAFVQALYITMLILTALSLFFRLFWLATSEGEVTEASNRLIPYALRLGGAYRGKKRGAVTAANASRSKPHRIRGVESLELEKA